MKPGFHQTPLHPDAIEKTAFVTPDGYYECVWNVVKSCHDDQGHFALYATIEKIKGNYWFEEMLKLLVKFVNACLKCLYCKSTTVKNPDFLHLIEKVAIPFDTTHLDHIEPFKRSVHKNTQILTIVNDFTKFCILEAARNTQTVHVHKDLLTVFYILIMDEKVLVLCEKLLSKISSNLYVLRPPESEKRVFTKVSVCLSVCRSCAA